MTPETVTLEDAVDAAVLSHARSGTHPETGETITVQDGRYGPYVKMGNETRSLETQDQLATITLDEAVAKLKEPKKGRGSGAAAVIADLGAHPDIRRRPSRSRPAATAPTSPTAPSTPPSPRAPTPKRSTSNRRSSSSPNARKSSGHRARTRGRRRKRGARRSDSQAVILSEARRRCAESNDPPTSPESVEISRRLPSVAPELHLRCHRPGGGPGA